MIARFIAHLFCFFNLIFFPLDYNKPKYHTFLMNLFKHLFSTMSILLCLTLLYSCNSKPETPNLSLIPLPNEISLNEGHFVLDKSTSIYISNELDAKSRYTIDSFIAQLNRLFNNQFEIIYTASNEISQKNGIVFKKASTEIGSEDYRLDITSNHIVLAASQPAGFLYAIQTLKQLLPKEIYNGEVESSHIEIPCLTISDTPRFGYRGLMIDVARHFYSVDQMKKIIDIMTLHKLNTLHWHLSDDQGWRIEIKKYPLLTEIGSVRHKTMIRKEWDNYDNTSYGGFYTQDQIREIVNYADNHSITVIPEIDLPGHMMAALASYPKLGCTEGPYEVSGQWGVRDDVLCPGKEYTFEFIEGVLTEVMDLFPSEYIHIGGDECPKVRWEKCANCQNRIKSENIKADDKHSAEFFLQSYTMARVEKFLNSKGRNIIGWDEMLEGELAPNATVMSWRGVKPGIEAARLGHKVIMTPGSHLYFDLYQTRNTDSDPLANGGYVPVEKVYSYEPIPADLNAEEGKLIIGTQANLWTEYITSNEQLEYMLLPRLAALSEVQWSKPEHKDWDHFLTRLAHITDIYDELGLTYANHIYEISGSYSIDENKKNTVYATLTTLNDDSIFYSLDGTDPTINSILYTGPIEINETSTLKAFVKRGHKHSRIFKRDFVFNKATGCLVELVANPSPRFVYDGASILTDGVRGDFNYATGRWLGYLDEPVEVIVDLGKPTNVSTVKVGVMVQEGEWLLPPTKVVVWTAKPNEPFVLQSSLDIPVATKDLVDGLKEYGCTFDEVEVQKIKILVETTSVLPEWHSAKGEKGFLFIDELIVD